MYLNRLLFLGFFPLLVTSVMVNPLPAPRYIEWSDNHPIRIRADINVSLQYPDNIVFDAFGRFISTLNKVKWYPSAIESPIPDYEPTTTSIFGSGSPMNNTAQSDHFQEPVAEVQININRKMVDLQLGVNESYSLKVTSEMVQIIAETRWGALHAIKTLQQLIIFDEINETFFVEHSVEIWDEPLFPHRGLMIDSSRNFLSIRKVKEQIDLMSISKLNSLHWHLTDTSSWPVEIKMYPRMIDGAYSRREIYTQNNIQEIVQYAFERGVRIIPEIDAPGHSRAGYYQSNPEILACADSWWTNTAVEPPPGQLDVLKNKTYEVLGNIYEEFSAIFHDNVFHVGADEVNSNCYKFSKEITDWFLANKSRTQSDLTQYWIDRSLPIFNNTKARRLTMWEDVKIGSGAADHIPTDVILQSWQGGLKAIKKLAGDGYDVIVSTSSFLYLDCGHGGWITNDPRYIDIPKNNKFNFGNGGSWCAPYKTWQRIYNLDITKDLNQTESKQILGAEAALWSEMVDDTVITPKIWPRLAALAEITWSGNKDDDGHIRTNYFSQRLFNFREYLVALGFDAAPLVPRFCLLNPHACDLTRNQFA